MSEVTTIYPATLMLGWDIGKQNMRGAWMDTLVGGILVVGDGGVYRRYSVSGSLIGNYDKSASAGFRDVAVDSTAYTYIDVSNSGSYAIERYYTAGQYLGSYPRPGIYSWLGSVVGKIFIRGANIYIPMTEVASPYRIRVDIYNARYGTLVSQWYCLTDGIRGSAVSGFHVDSTAKYFYMAFFDIGVVVKYYLHTEGGEYYLQEMWRFGTVGGGPMSYPCGLTVDEANGYVYVTSLSAPYRMWVLRASTGELLWTWDCYHYAGIDDYTDFGGVSDLVIDTNRNVYMLMLGGQVLKFKGFYDNSTHEVVKKYSIAAKKLWTFQFGPI